GVFIVRLDEGRDVGFEFGRGSMDGALQLLARQLCKPTFDLIDPGRRSWCEVNMPMRAARQPGLDLRRLVGGIIVHQEVYVRPLGHLGIDPLQKIEELGCSVACVALAAARQTMSELSTNRMRMAAVCLSGRAAKPRGAT